LNFRGFKMIGRRGGVVDGIIFGLFALSIILFFGMAHYLLSLKKTGVYPPKNILKKRAGVLGIGGGISFFLAIILLVITR
jgi:hypothetical protein